MFGKTMKCLFQVICILGLVGCTMSSSGSTGPKITIAKIYEISLTVDTNGEVHLGGNVAIPTPLRTKLADLDWLLAFDIAFNAAERSENTLYLLYEDSAGYITQDLYEINNPFEINFAQDEWVRRIKHNGRGNIVIFVERRPEMSSQPESTETGNNPPSSDYWCDDLSYVKLAVGDTAKVAWPKVNLRSAPIVPNDFYENIIAELEEDTFVTIIGGPECAHEGTWWEVQTRNGQTGWMRERVSDGYLIK